MDTLLQSHATLSKPTWACFYGSTSVGTSSKPNCRHLEVSHGYVKKVVLLLCTGQSSLFLFAKSSQIAYRAFVAVGYKNKMQPWCEKPKVVDLSPELKPVPLRLLFAQLIIDSIQIMQSNLRFVYHEVPSAPEREDIETTLQSLPLLYYWLKHDSLHPNAQGRP